MSEQYEYQPHRLLHQRVRDIASGVEGKLMAVINENVSDTGIERWMELSYIRNASGRAFTTAVDNVRPAHQLPAPAGGGMAGPGVRTSGPGAPPGAGSRPAPPFPQRRSHPMAQSKSALAAISAQASAQETDEVTGPVVVAVDVEDEE